MVNTKGLGRRYLYFILIFVTISTILVLFALRVRRMKQERRRLIFSDDLDENDTNTDVYADSNFQDYKSQIDTILKLRIKVKKFNDEQKVHNEYLYGPVSDRTTIIVIHVHTKIFHLKELLESLKQVADIPKSLLIFAHDHYDEGINDLIERIDFARYTQIFYPYSSQLHPRIFPGVDPRYCTELHHCEKATKSKRDAMLAQKKHSWWWKMNHIFDQLEVTKYYEGYMIFIDEDQYVTEDFIYTVKWLAKMLPDYCAHCEMISVGARQPLLSQYHLDTGATLIEEFGATEFDAGLAFNRSIWNTIKRLKYDFCYYNDYDWVNSLRYLATKRAEENQRVFSLFSIEGPRVFQIGQCMFGDNPNCSLMERMQEIFLFVTLTKRGLYPRNLTIRYARSETSNLRALGGWTDARDRELCMFIASKKRLRFKI